MKKYFFMLVLVLLVALVQASPPPGEMATFDLEEVSAVINVDATFVAIELQTATVWEVAHRPLYSLPVTVNKVSATDNKQNLTALITTSNDIEFTLKCPPNLSERKGKLNTKTFEFNRKNCNYGYPLSANEQHGKSFFS